MSGAGPEGLTPERRKAVVTRGSPWRPSYPSTAGPTSRSAVRTGVQKKPPDFSGGRARRSARAGAGLTYVSGYVASLSVFAHAWRALVSFQNASNRESSSRRRSRRISSSKAERFATTASRSHRVDSTGCFLPAPTAVTPPTSTVFGSLGIVVLLDPARRFARGFQPPADRAWGHSTACPTPVSRERAARSPAGLSTEGAPLSTLNPRKS